MSPFREAQGGKGGRRYVLCDKSPHDRVLVQHVPQIQLHCLATGALGALYTSYSAANGTTFFYVEADRTYQRQMLKFVSIFNQAYVQRQKRPPADVFGRRHDYRAFLSRTRAVARKARPLGHFDASNRALSTSRRAPFLD